MATLLSTKIECNDFMVEYEVSPLLGEVTNEPKHNIRNHISHSLEKVNQRMDTNVGHLEALDIQIDNLTSTADAIDNMVAIGSGILAGLIDSFWVGEFSMDSGKKWSCEETNKFVKSVAKKLGYNGNDLKGSIDFLENRYHIPSDNAWVGCTDGIWTLSHHLDDLAHHPTPIGLFCSILTQFTNAAYFQNSSGDFFNISLSEQGNIIGCDFSSKLFAGTVNWFLHLVSDMAGSTNSPGAGMGIPGPIISMLKELSLIPGVNKTGLSKKLNTLFVTNRFDLRTELAVAHQIGRQALPVIINEVIVRAFYFIRHLIIEIKSSPSFLEADFKKALPFKNRTIVRMITISASTFTLVDTIDAAIRSAIKSGGNPAAFTAGVLCRVNFVGLGRCVIAIGTDISMGANLEKRRSERIVIMSQQLSLQNAKIYYLLADVWLTAESTEKAVNEASAAMASSTLYFMNSMQVNESNLNSIGNMANEIQKNNPELIDEITNILTWG